MTNEPHGRPFRQERDRAPLARLLFCGAALVVVGALLSAWSWLTLRASEAKLRPSGSFPEAVLGPRRDVSGVEQRLFVDTGEGQRLAAAQRAELDGYRWVDADAGVVHVPIEDAMRVVVSRAAKARAGQRP